MHKYPFIILAVIIIVSVYLVLFGNVDTPQTTKSSVVTDSSPTNEEFSDYTAAFLVVTNGLSRDFSASRYHNLSQSVYITSQNPQIVHVQKPNITWQDFFSTLPMGLSSSCLTTGTGQNFCDEQGGSLRFFLNGNEAPRALEAVIQPNDKLLVTFGNASDNEIQLQIKRIDDPQPDVSSKAEKEEE